MDEVAGSGTSERPHGNPVPRTEVLRRMQLIEDLASRYVHSASICRAALKEHGISPRTTARYLAKLRAKWEKAAAEEAPERRSRYVARLDALAGRAEEAGRPAAAVSALRLAAEIDGVRAPEKIDVGLTVREEYDLTKLSDTELDDWRRMAEKARRG